MDKPYLYKGKAYRRSDTATVEVDPLELRRLTLVGKNLNFEDLKSQNQNLSFSILEEHFKKIGIQKINLDVLKTLNLYDDRQGYNVAGGLFADSNDFGGIDIIKFGDSIDTLKDRSTTVGKSILKQNEDALVFFKRYFLEEKIEGMTRNSVERIPEKAFREAVANALVHRTWDINANINIRMFDDRIEIISVGGVPYGITAEEYLRGGLSVLRNPIIANVFFRLHYIEEFGTGVQRIRAAYSGKIMQPSFEIFENSIKIILPATDSVPEMTFDERTVYDLLSKNIGFSSVELAGKTGFSKNKVLRLLSSLEEKRLAVKTGTARATKYSKS